jgi:hypothetical protein
MKTAWKWIVGVVVGLVGACFMGVIGLGVFGMLGRMMSGSFLWGSQMHRGYGQPPNTYGPGFGMHGFMPMAGIGGLLGVGLFILTIIGFGVGIVALVTALRKPQPATVVEAAVPTPGAQTSACKQCGKNIEAGWVACPYCGEKV